MLKKICSIIITTGVLFFTNSAYSAEFQTMGFKAVSMGGAGVATSRGSFATYYNPALLSYHKHGCEISLSVGVGIREINLADHIDTLSEIDISDTFDEMEALFAALDEPTVTTAIANGSLPIDSAALQSDVTIIKRELRAISRVNGLQAMPNASFGVQLGNFGFGLYNMGEATAFATIDADRLDFIISQEVTGYGTAYIKYNETVGAGGVFTITDEADYDSSSLQAAISPTTGDPSTYLTLSGIVYSELPVAYGHNFKIPTGNLAIGGSLKMIQGTTYGATIDIDSETDNLQDELEDSEKEETTMGVDLGLLYKPTFFKNLSIGLVGKNLNKPEFDTALGTVLAIDPQVRAGAALSFFNDKITLACDMDLTVNETYIEGYDSQFLGGGISFSPASFFSIRGGLMQNLQETEEGTIMTAGLGFGFKWIQLDIAGQYSSETGEFDGQEIPRYGKVMVSFVSKWK